MFGEEFISEKNGVFSIDRVFNDVKYNFGIFDSYGEALNHLEYLEEEGWPLEVNDQNENNLPNNIEEINGKFSVFKYIMDEKITFGKFDTIEEAKRIKNNLISNAWESLEFNDRGAYGKYIRKSGDKFIVSRTYNGETYNFGYFDNLDGALEVREHLVETNWGDLNIKHKMRLGKYITYNGLYYIIQKMVDGNLVNFGFFNELKDAKKQRDFLVQENWSRFEVPDDSSRHIKKDGDKYIIFNYINDEFQFFGKTDSLDEAKKIRNELIINDWVIQEEEKLIEEVDQYVFYDGEFYTVEKEFDDEIRIFGVFKNKNRAISCKNDLIRYDWDTHYAIKTNDYPYGEHIVPFDYIFYVEFFENGKYHELGNYMSFEEALFARNEYLEKQGNNNKLTFSVKVGKSYKNRGWSIIRDSTYDLIPKLDYEDGCDIIVDGIPCKAKLNILPRIFYEKTPDVLKHLEKLHNVDPEARIDVELILNNKNNHADKSDSYNNDQIEKYEKIILEKDQLLLDLNEKYDELSKENKELTKVIEAMQKLLE